MIKIILNNNLCNNKITILRKLLFIIKLYQKKKYNSNIIINAEKYQFKYIYRNVLKK